MLATWPYLLRFPDDVASTKVSADPKYSAECGSRSASAHLRCRLLYTCTWYKETLH